MSLTRRPGRPPVAEPAPSRPTAGALITAGYAGAAYLIFLAVLGYTAGFLVAIGVPKSIDQGARSAWPAAAGLDVALLLLFAVQHSVMARPWFKRRLTRVVPVPAERATYVLAASLVLALLFWLWRPIDAAVWHTSGITSGVLLGCNAAGWLLAITATFLISHSDLFGLRQAYLHARGLRYREPPFTERGLYRYVRHPLLAGFVVIIWASPVMTAGHLLFAAAASGYILIGMKLEERDLSRQLGEPYAAYMARVPALCPVPRRRDASDSFKTGSTAGS